MWTLARRRCAQRLRSRADQIGRAAEAIEQGLHAESHLFLVVDHEDVKTGHFRRGGVDGRLDPQMR